VRLLELFAGTKSVGAVAKEMGWEVFSSDILPEFSTDYTADILDFDYDRVPWIPDVIWASPPCTTFSVASIGRHWTGGFRAYEPKTEAAKTGMAIVQKTKDIIGSFIDQNPNLMWFIENPRGVLRKLPVLKDSPRRETVTYCQYGDKRMKPTDIWTNCWAWIPRPVCRNGSSCHEAAPRGSKTGTQGLLKIDRSRIPPELCREVLSAVLDGNDTIEVGGE
jgi:hypothetical protein